MSHVEENVIVESETVGTKPVLAGSAADGVSQKKMIEN